MTTDSVFDFASPTKSPSLPGVAFKPLAVMPVTDGRRGKLGSVGLLELTSRPVFVPVLTGHSLASEVLHQARGKLPQKRSGRCPPS